KGNAVSTFFASLFQVNSVDVRASAVAIVPQGPPAEATTYPLMAPSCALEKANGSVACDREIIIRRSTSCPLNPSDCFIDDGVSLFAWTVGTSSTSFSDSDLTSRADALVSCLKGDQSACTTATVAAGASLGTKTNNGSINNAVAASTFPTYLS